MADYADSGDYRYHGTMTNGQIVVAPTARDTRTCAERHDALLAWLVNRVDQLEILVRELQAALEREAGEL